MARDKKISKAEAELLGKLDGREIVYASERDSLNNMESLLGREGRINVTDSEIIVVCGNNIVFRGNKYNVEISELMSLEGVTIKGEDINENKYRTIVAYYKYYRKL